jgi:hypothetical protein
MEIYCTSAGQEIAGHKIQPESYNRPTSNPGLNRIKKPTNTLTPQGF